MKIPFATFRPMEAELNIMIYTIKQKKWGV